MRQNIQNFNNHAQPEKLKEYVMDAPDGTWTAHLDDHAWGKSQNLFVFFTEAATGNKYRLSVFHNKKYKPNAPYSARRHTRNAPPIFCTPCRRERKKRRHEISRRA